MKKIINGYYTVIRWVGTLLITDWLPLISLSSTVNAIFAQYIRGHDFVMASES